MSITSIAVTDEVNQMANQTSNPTSQPAAAAAAQTPENLASFRAAPGLTALGPRLGILKDLPGRWAGQGFNLIARPDFSGHNDIFLELNLTREHLDFTAIGSPIPNRGSQQADINLFGLTYLQQISDATTGGALHIEPGIWLNVPPTTAPPAKDTVARLACIPHGDAVNAQGASLSINGPPTIRPANTVPFQIGAATPAPGAPNTFPEYTLATPNPFRTKPIPSAITQAIVDDPNTELRKSLTGLTVTHTDVLEISTAPTGGVENIPFVVQNANAAFVSAIFWIETVQGPTHEPFVQLQYTQTVLLNFRGLSWPHVSVATLVKVF
jgi:hypothetical protein